MRWEVWLSIRYRAFSETMRLLQGGESLGRWWRVFHKVNALSNVALETLFGWLQQLLLVLTEIAEDIVDFLGPVHLVEISIDGLIMLGDGTTHAKLHGNREKTDTSLIYHCISSRNAGQVHVGGLDDTSLALASFDDLFGEAAQLISRVNNDFDAFEADRKPA